MYVSFASGRYGIVNHQQTPAQTMQNCSLRSKIQFDCLHTTVRWEIFQVDRPLQVLLSATIHLENGTQDISFFLEEMAQFLHEIESEKRELNSAEVLMSKALYMDLHQQKLLRFRFADGIIPLEIFIELNSDIYGGLKQLFQNLAPYEV